MQAFLQYGKPRGDAIEPSFDTFDDRASPSQIVGHGEVLE